MSGFLTRLVQRASPLGVPRAAAPRPTASSGWLPAAVETSAGRVAAPPPPLRAHAPTPARQAEPIERRTADAFTAPARDVTSATGAALTGLPAPAVTAPEPRWPSARAAPRDDGPDAVTSPALAPLAAPQTVAVVEGAQEAASAHAAVARRQPRRAEIETEPHLLAQRVTAVANRRQLPPEPATADGRQQASAVKPRAVPDAATSHRETSAAVAAAVAGDADGGAESDGVEIHIGRIEVKVAPPPVPPAAPAPRPPSFERYRRVRLYADRDWY